MGRTLPSATQVFHLEEHTMSILRQGLGRQEQYVLDTLFDSAHHHIAAVSYAAHPLPMEMFLLAMLLEQHKEVIRMRSGLEEVLGCAIEPQPGDPHRLF